MKVLLLRRAQEDLLAIRDWLALENPRAADRILERILEGIEQLSERPHSGPVVRDSVLARRGYRCLTGEGFLIFYRAKRRLVRVHRILHGRRDWRVLI